MKISEFLYRFFPKSTFKTLQKIYHRYNRKMHPPFNKKEFCEVLTMLGIEKGDVVFVHSSIDKLNIDFTVKELFGILKEQVGEQGTLLFPSWSYNGRTEDYIKQGNIFDVKKSFTLMGLLPEFVRRSKKSIRSLHPTASIAAYGKHANELVSMHHLSHYACDENSPMYKMMKYNAKIIGLGEKTVSMSFVHCIEDVMKNDFPVNIYYPEPFKTKYKDFEGKIRDMEVYVHHPNNQFNNIPGFTRKNISKQACQQNRIKGRNFFVAQSTLLFKEMMDLAKANKTIYN